MKQEEIDLPFISDFNTANCVQNSKISILTLHMQLYNQSTNFSKLIYNSKSVNSSLAPSF